MNRAFKTLLFLCLAHSSFGQTRPASCNCPTVQDLAHQGAPEKVFHLSNGNQIGLCGDFEVVNQDTIYTEVILYHCGVNGFFRGWDGVDSCKIHQVQDTIVVEHLVRLPVGKNLDLVTTAFKVEKFFYKGPRFVVNAAYRTDLVKYTASQIEGVIDQYKKLKHGDYDNILQVERKLFWAYVSGSADAGKYLESFDQQFGPFPEKKRDEFDEVHGLYWSWDLAHILSKQGSNEFPVP